MAVTRYFRGVDSGATIGRPDFEWFYSGTLQTGDDNKIPVKTKAIGVVVNVLEVVLYSAPAGADVLVNFYRNGSLLGTVTVAAGTLTGSTPIANTAVTPGDKMTVTIAQVGSLNYGITMAAYARVAA
jgi:hypothetical protein